MTVSAILGITFALGLYGLCSLGLHSMVQKADVPFPLSPYPMAVSIILSVVSVLWPVAVVFAFALWGLAVLFPSKEGLGQ